MRARHPIDERRLEALPCPTGSGHSELTLLTVSGLVLALAQVPAAQAAGLIIWWTKGINPEEEDEALQSTVDQWEAQTGKDAELSFYAGRDVSSKTIAGRCQAKVA